MDVVTLSQSKGYTNLVALGLSDVTVEGTTIKFTLNDGETASVTLPTPKDGEDGADGINGAAGKDAYTIAVEEGFVGTRQQWLDSLKGSAGIPEQIGNIPIVGDLIPSANGLYSIGSEDKKLKAIHAEELYMSSNTLYINGTPVFHTDSSDDLLMSADEDQSINVKTTGIANTNVTSEQTVQIKTTKEASNVNICAGDVTTGTTSNVNINASNNISAICNNQITQKAPYIVEEATNGVAIRGGLNVDGLTVTQNLIVQGETFKVQATDMEVKDNIIVVNKGESGSGVSKGKAGIRVDRGDAPAYNIMFDETDDMFKVGEDNALQTIASQEYVQEQLDGYAPIGELHTHDNKTTLDKLGESSGTLLFNGQPIQGGGGSGTTVVNNTILWDDYSTDEICVGRWTNGKPLYRKVVITDVESKVTQNIDINVSNAELVSIVYGGNYNHTSGVFLPYDYEESTQMYSIAAMTRDVIVVTKSNKDYWVGNSWVFVIQYTKTTDAENSFDISQLSTVSLQLQATEDDVEEALG